MQSPDPKNTIAFQGVPGAHSDLACRKAYPYMYTIACGTFEDVFEAVESGKAAFGMIPFENSHAGRVAEIHNLLPRTSLSIVGEHYQRIEHMLLGTPEATLQSVKMVYSHPQGLMQCRDHIRELGLETERSPNTALAAKQIAEWKDSSKAAIASSLAGELYGLKVLKTHMEDSNDNTTLFIVMAKEPSDPEPAKGPVVTTLLFAIRNIPAALYKSLGGFATNNVNLLKIESYIPNGTSNSAQFFVSFEGHPQQKNVQLAIEELGFFTKKVRVLGVYPAAPERGLGKSS